MKRGLLVFAMCLLSTVALATAPAPGFRAGAATSNVTPALGEAIIGGFLPFPSTNVHDELHARCLVLDDGRTKLALVVLDLLGIDTCVSAEARRLIEKEVEIPAANVLISAVHTHSATSALGTRFQFPQKPDEYQRFVARRIADGVKCAANRLRPAQLGVTTVQAPEHVNNRRWLMKPGTMPPNPFGSTADQAKMNPPAGSPNLVKPAGPTDPTVSILAVREPGGRPIAVFSCYSLHYVGGVGRGDISADYYGMYCMRLERLLHGDTEDPPMVALMANGTSGDINNIDFVHPRPRRQPYEQMRFVAEDLAAKVQAALAKVQYQDRVTLAARYRELPIATRRPTAEQMAWAKKTLAGPAPKPGKTDLSYIYAQRTEGMAGYAKTIPVPLQVLRVGSVCIGTMPNEVFCEIGLEFRKRSPLQPAFLVSLAHGYFGYLPTPKQHELGGYETWLGTSRFEPQASVKMLNALLEMASEVGPK